MNVNNRAYDGDIIFVDANITGSKIRITANIVRFNKFYETNLSHD